MSFESKAKPSSARSSSPRNPAIQFEQLETRSMMSAQPIGHDVSTTQSVELKPAFRASLVREAAALAAPVLRIRALSPDQVRLAWLAVDGATSYRIERFVGRSQDWQVIGTTDNTAATGSRLRGNRLYRYHVIAINAEGTESASEIISIRLNEALAHATMRAERIANMVESFRSQQTELVAANLGLADDMDFRRTVRKQQRAFAAQMLDLGVVYRPVAVESLMPVSGLESAPPRLSSVPPTVTIAVRNATELAVSWTAVTGGLSYKIERSVDAGSTWTGLAYSTGTRFVDVGLTADTSYQYRVTVITATDTSAASVAATSVTNQVAPSGLAAATADATTVNLTWSVVANATSYRIERSVNNTAWTALTPGTPLTGSSTSYADATGSAGTTYYYRITTVNGGRSSSASDPVAATTLVAVPTLTATALSGTRVNLTWTAGATAFEYVIERSDDAGTSWDALATSTAAHFVDAGLTANTDYKYRVSSTNAGGTTAPSAVANVTTLLATVTGFTATPSPTANSVTLDWTAVTDATSYRVDRSINRATWTTLSTSLIGTDDTVDDATVAPGTTYYYRIIAQSAGGNGAAGDSVSALIRPATPTGLTTVATSTSSVTIAWNTVTTATSYLVEKSTDSGSNWTTLGTPSGLNIVDSGLGANAGVQYRVSATNATGSSAATSVSSITTAPATPAGLAGTFDDTNNQNSLSWTAVTDATSYVIERSIGGGAWAALTPSPALTGTDASYDDAAGITAGTSYRYRISATNANGTSPVSSIVTVLTEPAVPTLTATTVAATSVTMSWTASTTATAYTLQFSDDAGSNWTTANTGSATTYTKTGLAADTAYSFQVLATNATGDSEYSTPLALTTLLTAPANFAATTPNGTSVVLAWDVKTNATGYQIERSANAGSTWTTLAPTTPLVGSDTTYTDIGLTASTAYRYRISATNANGTSAPATAVNITTRVGTPTGLAAATTSATALAVSWTAVTGATTYKLEGSTDGTTWADLATQAGVTYANTGLTANTTYSYRVSAIGTAGTGVVSTVVTGRTLLAAPAGFTVAAPTNASATLTWTASTGATGYKIEKSINAGVAWTVVTPTTALSGTDVTFTDTGLNAATGYQYRLSAISAVGTSAATSAATVLTRTNAAVVTGTVTSSTAVSLSWAAVTGASSYVVQKSADAGSTWSAAGAPSTLTQAVTGLASNTGYLFRVYAVNASGNSAASNSLALRTLIGSPTGLTTTLVSAVEVRLSWTAVTGATGYKLEKAVGAGAFIAITPTTAFTGSSAAYIDSGLTAGTVYKYRISAINAVGTSTPSGELATLTKPAAAIVTTTTTSTTQIALVWAAVPSATSYKVEISGDAGSTWSTATTQSGVTYNAAGLNIDSAYSFRVSAINATGTGATSTAVATRTLLAVPTGFELLDTSSTSITVAWTPSDNATSYVLERSANSGTTWTTVVTTPALGNGDSSYEDTGLAGGTAYQYRLSANNAAGQSAATSTVTGTTLPGAPTMTATVVSGTAINLSWTAATGATSYRLERSANGGATWATIASPTGTVFSDTGVQAARNYGYRVSAVNASGVGDTSVEVPVATLLASPTGFTATTASAAAISLAWTAPAGATGYKIERSVDTNTWTTLPQTLTGTAAFFSSTGLAAGTDYYYRITATAGTIVSPTSSIVRGTTTLSAPAGLAVAGASSTAINLTWTATTNFSRTGFKVQRSPNGTNSWATIATPAAAAVTYSSTGLTSATRYFYRLIAVSLAGDSAAGAVVNATTR